MKLDFDALFPTEPQSTPAGTIVRTPTTVDGVTGARNASLDDMVSLLKAQQDSKIDIVTSAAALRMEEGMLRVAGDLHLLDENGVGRAEATLLPTEVFDEQAGAKLLIPVGYLKRTRREHVGLYDANINGWLGSAPERMFMVRTLQDRSCGTGVARALMSDRYKVMDNLDVLAAALQGIRQAGHPVEAPVCDLSDRRMYVRIEAPQIAVAAREMLKDYRSPFSGQSGAELPTVHAGLVISNSEVGCGRVSITPRAVFEVCSNGLTITKDTMQAVHVGAKLDEGTIDWSVPTQTKELELITSKTADAVAHFLSHNYVEQVIDDLTKQATTEIRDPGATVKEVTKQLGIPAETADAIFRHFIKGGQTTAGGVMQAFTSVAQTVKDADAAHTLESKALEALALAAS
ncbi:DUF932 domain-containing protein [Streptomyces sp. BE147]|uniref:DUF932 domain-containing protein n=1 Tax=Streptomyces sp. BE147 TaxID=3002524 RepID=UPI002E7885A1|nr:DUF932 domain-containing protein [Streptomyces sp. BE147]MEE1737078.1 DUF932 domain-containing protein [Streptomyces sp. BE147]